MSHSYEGLARILDRNGFLLDAGKGKLTVSDDETGAWSGVVTLFSGSALESKSITALVEVDGSRALAQVGPAISPTSGEFVDVKVVGVDRPPF